MKPIHSNKFRLSRCPCCHSKGGRTKNHKYGNSAARGYANNQLRKELKNV